MQEDFLVVGLGNPGLRYSNTRHNLGFMVLDRFAESIHAPGWREKFSGHFMRTRHLGGNLTLLKPTTFMNLSGQSVTAAMNFFRIEIANLLVVHDDLDFPFGSIRLKKGGGTGGHKGISSIKQHLGSGDFMRLRLGIGRPDSSEKEDENEVRGSSKISNFVLDNFTQQDKRVLVEVLGQSEKALECVIGRGISAAMNEFNIRGGKRDGI